MKNEDLDRIKNYHVIEVTPKVPDANLKLARQKLYKAKTRMNRFKSMAYHKRFKINLSELDKTASDIDKALVELGVKKHKEVS
ncbi:hypothetical protein [Apilactobacillus xinyiensis]|uniref:hypothetical protein n=1 Tax=Apilactobacillus xinyiensis TaxID=2841032 RepID=UPI00200ED0F0|nr:hypothetical protein [Apilactobacillus xinyiensis]MCL0330582.1 hypothetical protein [Apilactobacillus xinyiensis]